VPLYGSVLSEVIFNVWVISNETDTCCNFIISYPKSLKEKSKIIMGFQNASTPDIPNCMGASDGIFIWTLKPSLKDEINQALAKRFFCGRKKIGLNCLVVSN